MDHDFQRAQLIVGAYVEKGMFAEALADKEKFRSVTPASSYWSWRAIIYGRSGQTEQAYHALHELLQSNQSHIDAIIIAWAYLRYGRQGPGTCLARKAYLQHSD